MESFKAGQIIPARLSICKPKPKPNCQQLQTMRRGRLQIKQSEYQLIDFIKADSEEEGATKKKRSWDYDTCGRVCQLRGQYPHRTVRSDLFFPCLKIALCMMLLSYLRSTSTLPRFVIACCLWIFLRVVSSHIKVGFGSCWGVRTSNNCICELNYDVCAGSKLGLTRFLMGCNWACCFFLKQFE